MWDLIVSVPDHCLSFYFLYEQASVLLKHKTGVETTMGIFSNFNINYF